jgi:hypothetical protein
MKMKNKFKDNFKINLYNFKIKGKIMCLFYFNHLFFLIVSRAEHYFNNNFQDLHILVKKMAPVHVLIVHDFKHVWD